MELVENFIGVLDRQHKLLEQLSNNQSGSLVSKNIIKSPNSTLNDEVNNSKLNTNEKSRVKDASSIFISKFFEEQKRQKKDTAEKTLVSKLKKPVIKQASTDSSSGLKQESGGWLSKLLGLLGLGALGKFLKPQVLKEFFKKGIAKLVGFFKKIISSIWDSIKGFFSKIWGGIKGFVNAIKNSKFVKGFGNIISKAWQGIKNTFSSVRRKIGSFFRGIGKAAIGLWVGVKSSKAFKAIGKIFERIGSAISGFFQRLKDGLLTIVKKVAEYAKNLIPESVKSAASGAGKTISKGLEKSKGFFGKLWGGAKSIVGKAGSGIAKGISTVGGMSADAAKGVVTNATKGVVKGAGGMFKLMGRLTAKGAARIPIIGAAIEAVLANMDINAMKKKGLTEDQLQIQAGRRVVTGVTGTIGAAGGAALAGVLGSIVPGAGTAIGAILGAIGGDAAGRFIGGLLADHVFSPKYVKSIGAFVTGTTPPKGEMQDFIIKDGQLHKFNRRDEIMGLKSGGAINEFLQSGGMQNQAIKTLINVNMMSIQYLKAIATNTALMVNNLKINTSSGNPVIVQSSQQSQPQSKNMVDMPNNRSGYLSSPYALA